MENVCHAVRLQDLGIVGNVVSPPVFEIVADAVSLPNLEIAGKFVSLPPRLIACLKDVLLKELFSHSTNSKAVSGYRGKYLPQISIRNIS